MLIIPSSFMAFVIGELVNYDPLLMKQALSTYFPQSAPPAHTALHVQDDLKQALLPALLSCPDFLSEQAPDNSHRVQLALTYDEVDATRLQSSVAGPSLFPIPDSLEDRGFDLALNLNPDVLVDMDVVADIAAPGITPQAIVQTCIYCVVSDQVEEDFPAWFEVH